MIPHISSPLSRFRAGKSHSEMHESPAPAPAQKRGPRRRGLAELPPYEGRDPTTEVPSDGFRLGLAENADERLRPGGADEHSPLAVELGVQPLGLSERRRRHLRP